MARRLLRRSMPAPMPERERKAPLGETASRLPGLVVAGHFGTALGGEKRSLRPIRVRGAGAVGDMRRLPLEGAIGILGRRNVRPVVHPAVPAGRNSRGLGRT